MKGHFGIVSRSTPRESSPSEIQTSGIVGGEDGGFAGQPARCYSQRSAQPRTNSARCLFPAAQRR